MGHSHHHHHDASSSRLGWAFVLNFCFTIIEFIGGWLTNSTAIMSDAVHDLGDSLSIGSAWVLNKLGKKPATHRFSYGFRRLSLYGALINSLVLIIGSAFVLNEAIPRLFDPVMPHAEGMLGLALLGVLVNGFAAYRLSAGQTLNEKVLNWHLMEDVLGWLAVLIVSVVLMFADIPVLDPLLSVVFTLFILLNVARNFWSTLTLFAQSVPDEDMAVEIRSQLLTLPAVADIHHLHFWSLDGEHHVLTAHLVLHQPLTATEQAASKADIQQLLAPFNLEHTTIELELPQEICRDQPATDQSTTRILKQPENNH
ncbi:cation diffusion facilitator family transporter [Bacterioplanoides pacificum]|uniref:Cation diffusion facilitator family transporter n=1 Tax=Bacterioplanoides pacificum TaxID=1171596 RepID=A0ABV7VSI7_9GAMM